MKCSNCGAENDPHSKFCFNCGNPLTVTIPMTRKSSLGKWLAIGIGIGAIGLLGICGFCLLLSLLSNSSPRDSATTNDSTNPPVPTSPKSSFTYEEIVNNAKGLTEIKRNEYYKSLISKSAHWSGKVADVSDRGDVKVRITSAISYDVVLQGVPKTTSTTLNLKDPIEFEGTITDVSDIFGSGHPIITLKFIALSKQ